MSDDKVRYTFTGRITPERTDVHVSEIELELRSENYKGKATISIKSSQILVLVDLTNAADDLYTLRNHVASSCYMVTDVLAYAMGTAYDIELTAVATPSDDHVVFGVGVPAVRKLASNHDLDTRVTEIMNEAYSTQAVHLLKLCMTDFRRAMQGPVDAGFFCYRAIESIRQYFLEGDDHNRSWEKLREELRVEKNDLMFVKEFADPRRHGDTIEISDEDRAEVYKITWEAIDNFIDHIRENEEVLHNKT